MLSELMSKMRNCSHMKRKYSHLEATDLFPGKDPVSPLKTARYVS
jgi:hypothetical protein